MENLIITKEYPGIIDEGYRYKIEGNLSSQASIDIQLDKGLFVSGYIEAGWSIKAGSGIFAGVCVYKNPSESELTITCGQLDGTVKHGILKLTGENSV